MAVLTGRSGQLYVGNTRVARCTGWSLDEQRPMLESTPVDVWDRTVVPGRRSGTGSAKLLYDPEDAAAGVFFDSILLNTKSEVAVSLILDSLTGESYPVTVHVSGASHAVARGEAQMRDISFKLSDTSISLEIIGNVQVGKAGAGLYTGAVYGLDGGWTFLWTSNGPTIDDPTAQTTNITFDALGTYTITLTATLGTTVLTDTQTVEVIDVPLMWINRATYLQDTYGGERYGLAIMDPATQNVYHAANSHSDSSVSADGLIISVLDSLGDRLQTKRVSGLTPGFNQYVIALYKLADNSLFMLSQNEFGPRWVKLSPDLSSITYQFSADGASRANIDASLYDATTDRVFFSKNTRSPQVGDGGNTPYLGYIQASTGTMTRYRLDMSEVFATSRGSIIRLTSGKILYAFAATNRQVFIEFNDDLKVGGIAGPIRTIDHIFSFGSGGDCTLIETDNYIALLSVGGMEINLYNKSDYTHVASKRFTIGGNGIGISAYFSTGQFVIAYNQNPGVRIARINENLSTVYSNDLIESRSIGGAPTAPGWSVPASPIQQSVVAVNNRNTDLGVFVVHARQTNLSLTTGEMVMYFRGNYSASDYLVYGSLWMLVSPDGSTSSGTTFAPTATANRSYTLVATPEALTLVTSSLSIANDTALTYETHVLAAP